MNFWVAWFDRTVPLDRYTGRFDEADNVTYEKVTMESTADVHRYLAKECINRTNAGKPASYVFSEIGRLSSYLKHVGWSDPYAPYAS